MATGTASRALLAFLVVVAVSASDDFAPSLEEQHHDILNLKNNCSFSVWPVIVPKRGSPPLDFTPYQFMGYEYLVNIALPHGWSALIWARTDCSTDDGRFTCATGDCGSGRLGCDGGARPATAATIAVLALGGRGGGTDAYHISVADGYNVPVLVAPYETSRGGGPCAPTQCVVDLDGGACPADQQVKASDGRVVACKPAAGSSGSSNIACTTADANAAPASSGSRCAVVDNSYTVTFCPDNTEFDAKPSSTNYF